MKAFAALIVIVGFAFSVVAAAAGLHQPGYVAISDSSMMGQFNVRYNTAAANGPYIRSEGYAGSFVYFSGRDSAGINFYCYVPTSSPLYQGAVHIKTSVNNGSILYVTKTTTSSECTNVYSSQASYALD